MFSCVKARFAVGGRALLGALAGAFRARRSQQDRSVQAENDERSHGHLDHQRQVSFVQRGDGTVHLLQGERLAQCRGEKK